MVWELEAIILQNAKLIPRHLKAGDAGPYGAVCGGRERYPDNS